MTETAHSPLGPSSADRWINCTGSVVATRGMPDTSSRFADEGTFAHHILDTARRENKPAKEYLGVVSEDGEFTVDREMVDAVQSSIDYIYQFEFDQELNEGLVRYDAWVDEGFGTLDCALLNDGTVIIADFKYGKGIQVMAENNSQLKLYALGVYQEYAELYDIDKFRLCIMQPRIGWFDEWEISLDELLVWADEVVEPKADEALSDKATFNPGEWCRWCKIRATCKARMEQIKNALLDEVQDIRDPAEMTNDELGEAMDLVPLIKRWCSDLQERAEKLVLAGEEILDIEGNAYKMVAGRGTRTWKDPEAAEKSLRNYKVKVADIFTKKLISPAQAEKLPQIGKGHPMLKKHVKKSQGKPALVPGSDPRPPYKTSADEMDDEGDEE